MPRKCQAGVYFITNLVNNKVYVGSSKNCYNREYGHFNSLRNGTHESIHLLRSFKKYGEQNFWFTIVEEHPNTVNRKYLFEREQMFIDALESYKHSKGYNILKTAGHSKGHKYTKEQNEANRQRNLGKKLSEEHRRAVSLGLMGREVSEETRSKISNTLMGHPGHGNKEVLQYSLDGNLIAKYRSVSEAANLVVLAGRDTKKARSCVIRRSCNNLPTRNLNFYFRWASELPSSTLQD